MKTRLLLIDSHPLIYRNMFSKNTKELKTSQGMQSGAFYGTLKCLISLRNRFQDSYMLCVFDGGASGRHEIYPGYKPMTERAIEVQSQIDDARVFCQYVGISTLYKEGIEADDLISVAARMWLDRHATYHAMIVSSDNDFFQLVTPRLTMYDDRAKKFYGPEEVFEKTKVKPQHFLAYKCYKGDVSDHVPGIKGFGPVKAAQYAPLGYAGVPEGYKDEFNRNRKLMRLPTDFKQMSHILSDTQQRQYTRDVSNVFQLWDDDFRALKLINAKQLLDYYEIISLKPEDFL